MQEHQSPQSTSCQQFNNFVTDTGTSDSHSGYGSPPLHRPSPSPTPSSKIKYPPDQQQPAEPACKSTLCLSLFQPAEPFARRGLLSSMDEVVPLPVIIFSPGFLVQGDAYESYCRYAFCVQGAMHQCPASPDIHCSEAAVKSMIENVVLRDVIVVPSQILRNDNDKLSLTMSSPHQILHSCMSDWQPAVHHSLLEGIVASSLPILPFVDALDGHLCDAFVILF